ncbi:uncharacterized protein B4U79_09993 [Dinothrombium tinctorium]|uniref:C2H2-type domain-containing protein n=1 Tax=Dinothrombium tinctorium TaxID=1965070 RepID=A0A443QG30_9ACAR|nr:uncharacterized protein B4U79_09993 [Dinothrombium tinctorium]
MASLLCKICNIEFDCRQRYVKHVKGHFENKINVECIICKKVQKSFYSYKYHLKRYHFEDKKVENVENIVYEAPHLESENCSDKNEIEPMEIEDENVCQLSFVEKFVLMINYKKEIHSLPENVVNDLSFSILEAIEQVINESSRAKLIEDMKTVCRSSYKQKKILNRICGECKVKEINLCEDVYHYTPITESLLFALNSNYKDPSKVPDVLNLQMYIDDFTFGNPLASNQKSKLFCAYYTISNISYYLQSKIHDINLLILAKRILLNDVGINKLFTPLSNEIIKIQRNGILFEKKGISKCIKVGITTICGDNLGIHEVAGLKKNFNSGCICRWCYAQMNEIQDENNFDVRNFEKRTKNKWEENLKNNCLEFGIKRPYLFHSLSSFDITTSLPPDVMHDLHEGILPRFLQIFYEKIVINEEKILMRNKYEAMKWKNGQFFFTDNNVPIIKGKAAKLFGKHYCKSLLWETYLKLRKVVAIIFGEINTEEIRSQLRNMILDFCKDYKMYIDEVVFPKLHYLCHYPDLMVTFGPLWKYSTMRYERKHNYFKQLSQRIKNSVNITFSLSERHSRLQRICKTFPKILQSDIVHIDGALHTVENDDNLLEVKKIFLNELQIEYGHFYIINKVPDKIVLAKIEKILIDSTETVYKIQASRHITKRFITQLFAYEIQDLNEKFYIKYNDIIYFRSLSTFLYKDKTCIPKIFEL